MDSAFEPSHRREPETNPSESVGWSERIAAISFLLLMSAVGVTRSGPYVLALRMYPRAGGGGINVLYKEVDGKPRRVVALDFHPVWDKKTKTQTGNFHAHSWQRPRKHFTIFNSGVEQQNAKPQNNKYCVPAMGFENMQNPSYETPPLDADEFCLRQMLRPNPF